MTDGIRDDIIRTKALKEMDTNAEVVDIIYNTYFCFDFSGKRNNGGATARGPKYKPVSKEVIVDKETAREIKDCKDLDKWVNDNKKEEGFDMLFATYKNISGDIYTCYNGFYKVEYADGKTTWLKNTGRINRSNYFDPLIPFLNTDQQLFVEPTDSKVLVDTGGTKLELESATKDEISEPDQLDEVLKHYLGIDNTWVQSQFGDLYEDDDGVIIPIKTTKFTYELFFSNPTDTKSPIWDICSVFNYEDPWNLENEILYYTVHPIGKNNSYNHLFIDIRSSEPKVEVRGITHKIRSYFPF